MSSDEKSKKSLEAQLEALVEAAGADAVNAAKNRKMRIKQADQTLNELIRESQAVAAETAHRSTRGAMNALFEDSAEARVPAVNLDVMPEYALDPDSRAELAGAQSASKPMTAPRQLEDGIDFWNELETLDREDDSD